MADKNREACDEIIIIIRWRWGTYLLGRGTGSESELSTVNVSMIQQSVVVLGWSTGVVWAMQAMMMVAQGWNR